MVNLDDLNKHDTVVVMENGGHYRADVVSIGDHEDPDGNPLIGVQAIYIHEQPSYNLESGETCNVYPDDIVEVKS